MSKQKSLILLKMLMGILNFAILTFLAVIILYTIGMVRATYTARSFLNHITYLPMNPVKTVIVPADYFAFLIYEVSRLALFTSCFFNK